MPTINLNRKAFESYVGKKLPDNVLAERINCMGPNVEKIDKNEIILEVDPNRPDFLSEPGFARAFSSFIGVKKGLREYNVKKSGFQLVVENSVKKIRPYTACAIVKNLEFDDEKIKEIIQIQEKLHITYGRHRKKAAIGIYPLEKIKFPVRFMADDPNKIKFRPLEFPKEITGLQILSQHPAGREYGHLLHGIDRFPFFIDANDNILSMPPVINSHETGKIMENTRDVFVECSGFDFNVLKKCLNMIVTALADMGGQIYSIDLVYEKGKTREKFISPDLNAEKWKVDSSYVNKILGLSLKPVEIKFLLEKMGFGASLSKGGMIDILVPAYRTDILHQVDFIEDIAIAYGYDNIKPILPHIATIGQESPIERFKDYIANILVGLDLTETKTYDLIGKEEQTRLMNNSMLVIEVLNPVTVEYNSLRSWVLPSLMCVLKDNLHNEYPQKIFDIGTIFKRDKSGESESLINENFRLAVAICEEKANFTKIKQILDVLMGALSLEYNIKETENTSFVPGRVGRVSVAGKEIAYIGEIHPKVLENFKIGVPVAAFELNITELFNITKNKA